MRWNGTWLSIAAWTTAAVEGATVLARLIWGGSAAEFNALYGPPVLFQMHHGVWGIALIAAGMAVKGRRPVWFRWLIGLGIGLIASDAIHHCLVLPLWVGNMGWH